MAHGDLWRETEDREEPKGIGGMDWIALLRGERWLVRLKDHEGPQPGPDDAAPATPEQMTGAEASPLPENDRPPDRRTAHEEHSAYGIPARTMEALDLMNRSKDSPTCPPPAPGPEIPDYPPATEPIPACVQVALDVLAIGPNRKFTTVADDAAADLLAAYLRQFVHETPEDQPEAPPSQQANYAARDAAEAQKHLRNLLHTGTVNLSGWNGLLAVQAAREYLANGPDSPEATDAPPE